MHFSTRLRPLSRLVSLGFLLSTSAPYAAQAIQLDVTAKEYTSDFGTELQSDNDAQTRGAASAGVQIGTFGSRFAVSYAHENGDFGAYVEPVKDRAGWTFGFRDGTYTRDASTTTIPFRIRDTRLWVQDYERQVREHLEATVAAVIEVDGAVVWQEEIEIRKSGDDFIVSDSPEHLSGTWTNDTVHGEYLFDTYDGEIDISNIQVGEPFTLQYRWEVSASQDAVAEGGAYAGLWDPIGDAAGGSMDLSGLTEVGGQPPTGGPDGGPDGPPPGPTPACDADPIPGDASAKIELDFKKADKDKFQAKVKKMTLPAGFVPDGADVAVDLGGSVVAGTLDNKGKYKSADGLDTLKLKQKQDGSYKLTAKRKKSELAPDYADEGLTNETNAKPGKPVTVDLCISIDAEDWGNGLPLEYKSKVDKDGTAK